MLPRSSTTHPATRLEILGIILDTHLMQMSLPLRKLVHPVNAGEAVKRQYAEIQSLAGHLQHAAKVV